MKLGILRRWTMVLVMAVIAASGIVLLPKAYAAAYEAEATGNTITGGATVSSCTGCSGGQKVGNVGGTGYLQFNGLTAGTSGSYILTISYATLDPRTAFMSVNGGTAQQINFTASGGWDTVGTMQVTITLNAGSSNTIKFSNSGGWAPNFDKIDLSAGAVYTYNQTSIADTSTNVTITNGAIQILYNKTTGLADYYWNNTKRLGNVYSAFQQSVLEKSKDYTSHTFSTADVATFTDGFGTGTRVTIVNSFSGKPSIRQYFYLYDGKSYFLTDVELRNGSSISTNYISPIRSDATATNLGSGTDKRALMVPFDNDKWSRYNAKSVNASGDSYEVFANYDNTARNGLVVGSVTHDTWKTGIWYYGTGNNLTELQVYAGAANTDTRDFVVHGSLSGTSIWSSKIFVGYFSDWRNGMEEYAAANTVYAPPLAFNATVPSGVRFGWNSWIAYKDTLNYSKVINASDFVKNNLQNNSFNNGGVAYINLDSYWDNLTSTELTNAVSHIHANGQKAGIYWAPFIYWFNDLEAFVEGTGNTYKYKDIIMKKWDGTLMDKSLDGAYPLDPTHPGTKQRIAYQINRYKSWSFDYIKLDYMTHGSLEGLHYDSNVKTGIQAYNQGMAYLDNQIGGTMFISTSIAPIFPGQYAHARRLSCDANGAITDSEYMLNNLYGWWMNGSIYASTDPDHIVLAEARVALTSFEEARTRVNSAAIAGTLMLDSDDLLDTTAQSRAISLLTDADINGISRKGKAFRPVEGNTGTAAADTFVLNDNGTFYLAVFNFSASSIATKSIDLARAGLNGSTTYTVTDQWGGSISSAMGTLNVTLGAKESKLYKLN